MLRTVVPKLLLVPPLKQKNISRSIHCFTSVIIGGAGKGGILSYCYKRKPICIYIDSPLNLSVDFPHAFPRKPMLPSPILVRGTDRVSQRLTVLTQCEGWVCMFRSSTQQLIGHLQVYGVCGISIYLLPLLMMFLRTDILFQIVVTSSCVCRESAKSVCVFYINPKFKKRHSFKLCLERYITKQFSQTVL